jgi:hypothetical protein
VALASSRSRDISGRRTRHRCSQAWQGCCGSAPRSSYVSTGHGDVVNLPDASGTVVASYADAACGMLTSSSETLPNGWTNPYRSNGRDGVRADSEPGRSWMRVRCAPTTRAWAAASAAIRWAVPRPALPSSRTPTWATTR